MSKISSFLAGNGSILVLSGAAVLVMGGLGVHFKDTWFGAAPESVASPQAVVLQDEPVSETLDAKPVVEPDQAGAPKFDVARVEPDGQALIAGTALPGETVEVLLDGVVIAEATVGSTGEFAAFADLPQSDEARVLSLRGKRDNQVSLNTIIVAPIIAIVPETVAGPTQAEPDAASETVERSPAQAVLMASDAGVELVQPASPAAMSQVALDAISYSEGGDVQLAGRAPSEGFVRVYLDNKPITTERIEESGNWRTELPNVDTGVYTLRVDKVDETGQVQSRVETPFKREEPTKITSGAKVALVTVQPGATLWAIARDRYGQGELYFQLYEANKDQIRDPDLIYPGQVFDIPG